MNKANYYINRCYTLMNQIERQDFRYWESRPGQEERICDDIAACELKPDRESIGRLMYRVNQLSSIIDTLEERK